jgi:hypothetical protein
MQNESPSKQGYAEVTQESSARQAIENKGVTMVEAGGVGICSHVANREVIENATRSKRTGRTNCAQLERIWNAENCDPHGLFNDPSLMACKTN